MLLFVQIKTDETPKAEHGFVENTNLEIPSVALLPTNSEVIRRPLSNSFGNSSPNKYLFNDLRSLMHMFLLQELMNEQLMDQQSLMNQQHPPGETDTTIKPSQEYNVI
jgi:hypothetical protein